jgi:putative membrane protein
MMNPPPSPPGAPRAKSSDELAQERTELAIDRTLMAADRSLMAWVRTGLSMISFGFTIYKIIEAFQQQGGQLHNAYMARNVGLFLTGLGTVAVVTGTLEYWFRLKDLGRRKPLRIMQPSFVIALVMSAAGLFMFIGITSRLL